MTGKTSIEAYNKNKDLLSTRRWQVYDILVEHGPLTASELFEYFKVKYKPSFTYNMNVHSRLNELEKVGVAKIIGERKCSIKDNMVYLWESTDNVAIKLEKPMKIPCPTCKGKGHFIEQQIKMF